MTRKLQGIALGILVLTLAVGIPPAYALLGGLKKKANSVKNTATSTASSAKNTAASTVSSVNHQATQTASTVVNSEKAQTAKKRVTRADQQATSMVGGLADVFGKIVNG